MTTDVPDVPTEFDLGEAPAEGDGYYQAKTRQWVDLCPHMSFSEKILLHVLTDLTTRASSRRKLSLDKLIGIVPSAPVAVGEEPKFLSPSGLLRILRNLAALGQITADEDGTPLTFSSRESARSRPVGMTVWRLPRHECGCHRNVFDALASVTKGQEPRYEPAQMDDSAVRRRPKRAGHNSDPRRGAGQNGNPPGHNADPRGQNGNPRGHNADPHSQDDQPEHAPPITPPSTPSSSSSGSAGVTPSPRVPADEEDDTSSTPTNGNQPGAVDLVREMTDATEDEATAVLERVKADYTAHHGRTVRSIRRYVSGFDAEDLTPHLDAVRAQRASEARAEANETAGVDTRCHTHHEPLPCDACKGAPKPVLVGLLRQYGAARRPDIARRLDELVGAR